LPEEKRNNYRNCHKGSKRDMALGFAERNFRYLLLYAVPRSVMDHDSGIIRAYYSQ